MKKAYKVKVAILNTRNKNKLRKQKLAANIRKAKRHRDKRCADNIVASNKLKIARKYKTRFQRGFYKKLQYEENPQVIKVDGHFGIEKDFGNFIKISSSFIDHKSKSFLFDFDGSIKVWPSAITLLCSFKQWTELTSNKNSRPKILSLIPKDPDVDAYLHHCGFYSYVNANSFNDLENKIYNDNEIVKIKRESNKSEIEIREKAINSILKEFSTLTNDQIEKFDCNVLIEAINNVTEHGRSFEDNGWWTLTQYHKTTGIISLCIADNGIGIKNTLLTGPQRNELKRTIKRQDRDGDYLNLALSENVSGALMASTKDKKYVLPSKYPKGSRRGNGLKRIKDTCIDCSIEFNILSQKGYLTLNSYGEINYGTADSRVFAGTLYHFVIPAKKQLAN